MHRRRRRYSGRRSFFVSRMRARHIIHQVSIPDCEPYYMRANATRRGLFLNKHPGIPSARDELASKFSFGSQCGPIPLGHRIAITGVSVITLHLLVEETNMIRTLSIVVVLLAGSGAAWAQGGLAHTPAEERACRGDAHRLCKNVLSDEFQVASCLQENRHRVSHGCRTVLESHK
jgi:hypothetical protein